MMKQEKLERADVTRSVLALITAVGCFGSDQPAHPLTTINRIYVDKLNGDSSPQIRDMIINALQGSKLFVITENKDNADATLRGSAEDLIYTDTFQSSEGLTARASLGSGSSRGRIPALNASVGEQESQRSTERKHEATAAVRLIGKDGDVIWSTTQESHGAKFRGASADVADKVIRQLLADMERARRPVVVDSFTKH
ncbi:MAG: hypothetical protein H7Y20_15850 [Bryobacteraceae bacterium]|nr:hypothetical protein [Bryobacteraceae bacterium]